MKREREREGQEWGCIVRSLYLRARRGRFSVNLRVIPVISCLENHAVALMLHCLTSRPCLLLAARPAESVLLPVYSHYFNYAQRFSFIRQ